MIYAESAFMMQRSVESAFIYSIGRGLMRDAVSEHDNAAVGTPTCALVSRSGWSGEGRSEWTHRTRIDVRASVHARRLRAERVPRVNTIARQPAILITTHTYAW
jgi:hypothetical protein